MKIEEKLIETLSKVEEAISTAAPEVWGAALKRVFAEAVTDLVWGGIFAVASAAALYLFIIVLKKDSSSEEDTAAGVVSLIVLIVGALISAAFITDATECFLAPEWAAAKLIMGLLS